MMGKSEIEWTDMVWNPVTGCTKVSQGCKNCYAERFWHRWSGEKGPYAGRPFTDVQCHPERLDQPLRWKKPRRIFVNSMSDLFHEDVPDEFIDQVFAVAYLSPQHTFQVLTKRAKRMAEYMNEGGRAADVLDVVRNSEVGYIADGASLPALSWPPKNLWLGVSAEDQQTADERIPLLLQTPAAVRWVSAEPLLDHIDLMTLVSASGIGRYLNALNNDGIHPSATIPYRLDWVVVGGESGPHARPMHPDWARSLRNQCASADVAFYFKQWGEWAPNDRGPVDSRSLATPGSLDEPFIRVGKRAAGRLLDGRLWDEYPVTAF